MQLRQISPEDRAEVLRRAIRTQTELDEQKARTDALQEAVEELGISPDALALAVCQVQRRRARTAWLRRISLSCVAGLIAAVGLTQVKPTSQTTPPTVEQSVAWNPTVDLPDIPGENTVTETNTATVSNDISLSVNTGNNTFVANTGF
ncbi:MAG TPA: hypothetical protein VGE59_01215 [Patescibacteria group bacterium]